MFIHCMTFMGLGLSNYKMQNDDFGLVEREDGRRNACAALGLAPRARWVLSRYWAP